MDLRKTLRMLRLEKRCFDQIIGSVEDFQRSKPFQAIVLLDDLLLETKGRRMGQPLHPRHRRRLSRWLREWEIQHSNGNGRRRGHAKRTGRR